MSKPGKFKHTKHQGRGVNGTGRSKRTGRFVKLEAYMLESEAWRSLGVASRALYVALRQRFNGSNNGRIGLSVRGCAAELKIAKGTATKAFRELEAKGFIRVAMRGNFNWKKRHASEWVLTEENYGDKLPTKEFMRWHPPQEKAGPKRRTLGLKSRTEEAAELPIADVTVPNEGPNTLN